MSETRTFNKRDSQLAKWGNGSFTHQSRLPTPGPYWLFFYLPSTKSSMHMDQYSKGRTVTLLRWQAYHARAAIAHLFDEYRLSNSFRLDFLRELSGNRSSKHIDRTLKSVFPIALLSFKRWNLQQRMFSSFKLTLQAVSASTLCKIAAHGNKWRESGGHNSDRIKTEEKRMRKWLNPEPRNRRLALWS